MAKEKNGVLTQTYHPLYKEKKKRTAMYQLQ